MVFRREIPVRATTRREADRPAAQFFGPVSVIGSVVLERWNEVDRPPHSGAQVAQFCRVAVEICDEYELPC